MVQENRDIIISNKLFDINNHEVFRNEIDKNGYHIVKNAIDIKFIHQQRLRWLKFFNGKNKHKKFVRGSLIMGEPNFSSYANIKPWAMFRFFEFLWNKNDDDKALDVHINIHKIRNSIQGFSSNYGVGYNSDGYGIYISTSYYPCKIGKLEKHSDGHGDTPILHYMLPLTFKGIHYDAGGLFIEDKQKNIIDIDQIVEEGDLILFDGRCNHFVEKIESTKPDQIGRLAVFAIPTFFDKSYTLQLIKRTLSIYFFELKQKIKQLLQIF